MTKVIARTNLCALEKVWNTIVDEECLVAPKKEAYINVPPSLAVVVGSMLSVAYRHRNNLFGYFQTVPLKNVCWQSNGCQIFINRFQMLMMQRPQTWSGKDVSFMLLCLKIDTDPQLYRLLAEFADTDWFSNAVEKIFPLFEASGLRKLERPVAKDGIHGIIDGVLHDNVVVELKFCEKLTFEHKLQAVLYSCMHEDSTDETQKHCILWNYRHNHQIKMLCHNQKKLFQFLLKYQQLQKDEVQKLESLISKPHVKQKPTKPNFMDNWMIKKIKI